MRHPVLKLPGLQLRQRVGLTEGGVVVRGIRDGRELDVELRDLRLRDVEDLEPRARVAK